MDAIAILDFGSQTSQLIARRVREACVYCELFPYDASRERVLALEPKGFILSGGPASVYEDEAPQIPEYILESKLPILGICYGMQALTHSLGGCVAAATQREYGMAKVESSVENPLLPLGNYQVWMSHGDRIEVPPPDFEILAASENSPIAAIGDKGTNRYGLQFHPEVRHTPEGNEILRTFVVDICKVKPQWIPTSIIETVTMQVRSQVGKQQVIAGVSGGVDSSVAAALVHRAIGDQLTCIFINNGLLRHGEPEAVAETFNKHLGARLIAVDATEAFLEALHGVSDPEIKRKIIGELFIRKFEEQAQQIGQVRYLVQGTIYPDVVESSAPDRQRAARIKTHHNVGGLPADLNFELVEPLRYMFKDEVRAVGLALGLPEKQVWRHPFPGPGLAVRCLGEITFERLARLRAADRILLEELQEAGLMRDETAQAFAVLLPIRSVGVMGDQRTYAETLALRAVTTEDFMTADWARLPYSVLARISNRIVNEVPDVNRVVYDITSKPPATIEWE
ncbi:MAG: GMP synthase [Anaerolineae bacterium SM23_ 63]|nr:MAG: GMP synthase [Anaerolineae bacterium SM23_ 63]HEY47868.1 glutamine-hydrolyzing GMP synthase [Anaerolineae bacterium]